MSKWRPNKSENIYVIGDIHGRFEELSLILKRIIPLRKQDKLIFLGDYIDRGLKSREVINKLIELKKEYPNQVITLKGNHEWLMLAALGFEPDACERVELPTQMWLTNGGINCLQSYQNVNIKFTLIDLYSFTSDRLLSIIPKDHIDFIKSLDYYYEYKDYIFVHGGCDPLQKLSLQDSFLFMWDRSLFDFAQNMIKLNKPIPWNKCIITGHNYKGPIINDKFMMLDCSSTKKLFCLEINSKQGFFAENGNKRLVKYENKDANQSLLRSNDHG